jgi:hypothetical protein
VDVFHRAKKSKKLLVLRWLYLLRKPALAVLPDLAVILPEVLVHRGVHLLLGRVEVAAGLMFLHVVCGWIYALCSMLIYGYR